MTDTITMDRAEYDETTAQLRSQAAEIRRLHEVIEKARIQISGGLTYFSAASKHAQLVEADEVLRKALEGESDE